MSDARSLLRAHRAANRVEHPHAAYSDAGKLLCKLCHEAIKSESLWDGHLRSPAHRQKLTALQQSQASTSSTSSSTSRPAAAPTETIENTITTTTTTINHKRKHGVDDDDIDMDEAEGAAAVGEDAARRQKKSRTDTPQRAASTGVGGERASNTPPSLTRRTSNAPEKGVEIAIPSRPATPQLSGRSPLIGSGSEHSGSTPNTSHGARGPTSAAATTTAGATTTATAAATQKSIDEAEWALFEAEVANDAEPTPPPPSSLPNPSGATDAVISAPALTADQLAAKSQEEEHERRKLRFDTEIADEREDATRALEDEFDEMEELEARVRKLKEKREELRLGSMANLRAVAAGPDGGSGKLATAKAKVAAGGKENGGIAEDTEEDDDEEDEEDFDDGFRFRV